MGIQKRFSDPEYGGDPEDTSRIQRIRSKRWNPEDTKIPGSAFSPLAHHLAEGEGKNTHIHFEGISPGSG
jgi:hypothetical protein